jgi:hypothetical protein
MVSLSWEHKHYINYMSATFCEQRNACSVLELNLNMTNAENEPKEEDAFIQLLESPYQLEQLINRLKRVEVQEVINSLNTRKSSSYDLITGKVLKEFTVIGIRYLTYLFNAVLLTGYFPTQCKVAQIILISKPSNPPNSLTSCRSISLLPIHCI